MKTYHVGLIKGTSGQCWDNGHRPSTVIVQLRRSIDDLSPDLWCYMGEHETTKKRLRKIKEELLETINKQFNECFKYIIID